MIFFNEAETYPSRHMLCLLLLWLGWQFFSADNIPEYAKLELALYFVMCKDYLV